jgi:hypothetical protein
MNLKDFLLNAIFFVCASFSLYSQNDSIQTIKGKTIDVNKKPVSFVSIMINGKPGGTISNNEGKFQIHAKISDTLFFSSIAYKNIRIPVSGLKGDTNYITLQEAVYELGKINIREARWQDFKYDMMNAEIDPLDRNILIIKGLPDPFVKMVPVSLVGSPVSFLYEYFKRENVIKRKQKRWNKMYENNFIKVEKVPEKN